MTNIIYSFHLKLCWRYIASKRCINYINTIPKFCGVLKQTVLHFISKKTKQVKHADFFFSRKNKLTVLLKKINTEFNVRTFDHFWFKLHFHGALRSVKSIRIILITYFSTVLLTSCVFFPVGLSSLTRHSQQVL